MSEFDEIVALRPQDQLCFALYSSSRAFTKIYAELLKDMGLTYPQYIALMVLWNNDGLQVSEIAATMEIDPATASPLIQRLEKLELVRRVRGADDERCVRVFLSEKGRAFYEQALTIPDAMGCATGVSAEQAERLVEELRQIRSFINETGLQQLQTRAK